MMKEVKTDAFPCLTPIRESTHHNKMIERRIDLHDRQ